MGFQAVMYISAVVMMSQGAVPRTGVEAIMIWVTPQLGSLIKQCVVKGAWMVIWILLNLLNC